MSQPSTIKIQPVGGPTAIVELAGLRLILDPTFDPPGDYDAGNGLTLTKLAGPAIGIDEVGRLDAVLLSHDQHADNLDDAGRGLLGTVPTVLTTTEGAARLGGDVRGLEPYESVRVGEALTVTAVPAQHGPEGTEHLSGPVVGFVLEADGAPRVYVSGDNASVDVARTIADRLGPFDIAILNVGGAQVPFFDDPYVTLSNERAVEVARALAPRAVVALHHDGWSHFTQDGESLRAAFVDAGLGDRLRLISPGTVEEV
jgi:L-ascorbate metabolism protein UlaG (beta-lactamase superfamily)